MKFATLKQGGRDGTLVVVSRDLKWATTVDGVPTLQGALDDWNAAEIGFKLVSWVVTTATEDAAIRARVAKLRAKPENRVARLRKEFPELAEVVEAKPDLWETLGDIPGVLPFDPAACAAPLPRAYQWADGSAYVNHMELVRKARGAEMPESSWTEPLIYQGGSDAFLGPCDPILVADDDWGIDFEAEVAVVTDDVPMGVAAGEAGAHIVLLMLVNDVSLRNLVPGELAKGFGFFQAKPSTAFAPVAVTPDELGPAWDGGRLHLPLVSTLNGDAFGRPNAGVDMTFDFPALIAHAAKTRPLSAGTIIGSGTVSNVDRSRGSSCIAERRMIETLEQGQAETPFLRFGDRVRIEMFGRDGASIFGAIDQEVQQYKGA